MKCPDCGQKLCRVVDVRIQMNGKRKWRRRECTACLLRFNTLECYAGKSAKLVPYDDAFNEACNDIISRIRSIRKKK